MTKTKEQLLEGIKKGTHVEGKDDREKEIIRLTQELLAVYWADRESDYAQDRDWFLLEEFADEVLGELTID